MTRTVHFTIFALFVTIIIGRKFHILFKTGLLRKKLGISTLSFVCISYIVQERKWKDCFYIAHLNFIFILLHSGMVFLNLIYKFRNWHEKPQNLKQF